MTETTNQRSPASAEATTVLARKYRPRNFSELVGQSHVARALEGALVRGRLHHAYLFTGTRGVGKTTIARILAKCLNCETGITATPCGVCATCVAIDQGRYIDLIEIDAASRTRVEDTRELLDNVAYAPSQGRYKVYLIDEVHMLSTHSFNALLKTLEEPPAHVKFLLATTDPQKLPITVLSRCLQFGLRPISLRDIEQQLQHILTKEAIPFEKGGLSLLADAAQGSLRDALSLTDQAIAFGQGQVIQQDVMDMLGLDASQPIGELLLWLVQGNAEAVGAYLMSLATRGRDVSHMLDELIGLLHQIALVQQWPRLLDTYHPQADWIQRLAAELLPEDVQLYYQLAITGRRDLPLALTPQQGFDMLVLRMLAFRPLSPDELSTEEKYYRTDGTAESSQPVVQSMSKVQRDEEIAQEADLQPQPILPLTTASDQGKPDSLAFTETIPVPSLASDDREEAKSVLTQADHEAFLMSLPLEPVEEMEIASPGDLLEPLPLQVQINQSKVLTETNAALLKPEQVQTALAKQSNLTSDEEEAKLTIPSKDQTLEYNDPWHQWQLPIKTPEGQWQADMFEYWLHQQVQQGRLGQGASVLAQQSRLTGPVGGAVTLHLPARYQSSLGQLLPEIEQAIQQDWPQGQLQVQWIDQALSDTPLMHKQKRHQQAEHLAQQQLLADPIIQHLQQQMGGEMIRMSFQPPEQPLRELDLKSS